MQAQELIDWLKQIRWSFWIVATFVLRAWIFRNWKRQASQRKARAAEDWPMADGVVQSIKVVSPTDARRAVQDSQAVFTYSYSVHQGDEVEYYSGNFSRNFSDEGDAWDWLRTLENKRIRVRVKPGHPSVSAVLEADLSAVSAFAPSGVATPVFASSVAATPAPQLTGPANPQELRGTTEFTAQLATLGFVLCLVDHICRLVHDKPLYPYLNVWLWGVGVALLLWYHARSGEYLIGKGKGKVMGPAWVHYSLYVLNLYGGLFWFISLTFHSHIFHGHFYAHQLEPWGNGAFLAIFYGDAAAMLYGKLESYEDPYKLTTSGIHPE